MGRYQTFVEERRRQLRAMSEVAETDLGPIEFTDTGPASAVPLLVFHGGPGGCDQTGAAGPAAARGYRVIGWSRPGYLRTPISVGPTYDAQGDAAAALLAAIGVREAVAHGLSAGGPSSIEFVRRHPELARGLILESAVTRRYAPHVSKVARAVFLSGRGTWITGALARRFPKAIVADFVKRESTLDGRGRRQAVTSILEDPGRRAVFEQLMDSLTPYGDRAVGLENDLVQMAALDDTLVDGVRCPTLIVHGSHDGDADPEHARHAAVSIPDARLRIIDEGWHVLALSDRADDVFDAKAAFLAALGVTAAAV